jgi:hypothetical protein
MWQASSCLWMGDLLRSSYFRLAENAGALSMDILALSRCHRHDGVHPFWRSTPVTEHNSELLSSMVIKRHRDGRRRFDGRFQVKAQHAFNVWSLAFGKLRQGSQRGLRRRMERVRARGQPFRLSVITLLKPVHEDQPPPPCNMSPYSSPIARVALGREPATSGCDRDRIVAVFEKAVNAYSPQSPEPSPRAAALTESSRTLNNAGRNAR